VNAEFIEPQVIARLARVGLAARLPMSGQMSGQHRSPHRGSSVEFAEYRKYAPGDDIRLLDWRVYARSDRFYIKEFEADTNLRAYFVVDCSGSMGFGKPGATKLDYARRIVGALASVAVQQGDAVGLACVNDGVTLEIPARRRPAHLRHLFDGLREVRAHGGTGLAEAVHLLAEKVPKRSMVVVVSDCFSEPGALLSSLQHASFRRHDVALFHLLDREEVAFDLAHPTRFIDLESPATLLAEPEMIRERYFAAFERHNAQIQRSCREWKMDYRRIVTDQEYEKALSRFLLDRQLR
jgi:uncharacterized protein (DUF58 family)